ncbi:hypothetical protein ACJJTC_018041 [Scirpophaga incertulas]
MWDDEINHIAGANWMQTANSSSLAQFGGGLYLQKGFCRLKRVKELGTHLGNQSSRPLFGNFLLEERDLADCNFVMSELSLCPNLVKALIEDFFGREILKINRVLINSNPVAVVEAKLFDVSVIDVVLY